MEGTEIDTTALREEAQRETEASRNQSPGSAVISSPSNTGLSIAQGASPRTRMKDPNFCAGVGSDAKLYCPKTGHEHSVVLDLGLLICPACSQDLTKKQLTKSVQEAQNGTDTAPGTEAAQSDISYEIEYTDLGGNWIGRDNWNGPFDLQSARRGVVNPEQQWILKVVTVLRTSYPADLLRDDVVKKTLMDDGMLNNPRVGISVNHTKMVIYSQPFISALAKMCNYWPDTSLSAQSIEISEPYCIVAHHRRDLEAFQSTHNLPESELDPKAVTTLSRYGKCDEETYRHIETVLSLFRQKWETTIEIEERRYSQPVPKCTYKMLWLLFKPGDTVYFESDGKLSAAVVQQIRTDPAVLSLQPSRLKVYKLTIWCLGFDGRYVRRWSKTLTITPFNGEMDITKLTAFPSRFMDQADGGKTRATLVKEGERWFQLLQPTQARYQGESMDKPPIWINSRVIVDCGEYETQNKKEADPYGDVNIDFLPFYLREKMTIQNEVKLKLTDDIGAGASVCPCERCIGLKPHSPLGFPWDEYDLIDPLQIKSLDLDDSPLGTKHRYLLCPRKLGGFVLKTRSWQLLDVSCCHDVRINKKAINSLVIPSDKLEMIKALVHWYSAGSAQSQSWTADFVENKGEGRIFLLHGSPGVGKTYTAECIAEYTTRPLLSLTCGDLGDNETEVEKELSKWFTLAERWGAVMLLDEADVYTEKRMITDLKRNSMVSVFLRCMEYYKGILFLTTNRVGTFDDAFVSRIHVIIHYKNLGEQERKRIWENFFAKLSEEREDMYVRSSAKKYVLQDPEIRNIQWNGREIRNAFQTAVALADYEFAKAEGKSDGDGPELKESHFEKVCSMAVQFKEYLNGVHDGLDENGRAALTRARARENYDTSLP